MDMNDERKIGMKIIFNGNRITDEEDLMKVTINESAHQGNEPGLGVICGSSVKIEMRDPGDIPFSKSEVKVLAGVNDEWQPMGVYVITSYTHEGKKVILEGYDHITQLEKDYHPDISYPSTVSMVISDIVSQCQLTLKENITDDMVIEAPMETTCREMLSFMASLNGKNVKCDRDGKIVFYAYEGDKEIDDDVIYQDSYKITGELQSIDSLTSGSEENVITAGSGKGMTFLNPYMNEERLQSLLTSLKGFTYRPCSFRYRGDISVQSGEVIRVHGENVVIMDQTLTFDGGMSSVIECYHQEERESVMQSSPTEKKLKKLYQTLLNSFKETTETLLGHKGGYYMIDQTDGYPSGWTIMNTPTLRDDTHLWRMNMGGFGYSEDGGKTFRNYAFDMSGRMNANIITTGILQGDGFDLDLESGDIRIGERNKEGLIESPVFSYSSEEGLHIEAFQTIEKDMETLKNTITTTLALNYVNNQTHDEPRQSYYPDYTIHPLKITPLTEDTFRNDVISASYTWKRKGQSEQEYSELTEGEAVEDGVLLISHNLEESTEYKVYASVITDQGDTIEAEASVCITLSIINEAEVNGEMCVIEAPSAIFREDEEGNFSPSSITLTPHFMACGFDLWLYSSDLGHVYEIIEKGTVIKDEEGNDTDYFSTDIEGISISRDNELFIEASSPCFQKNTAIVFQLKADREGASDTVTISHQKDITAKVSTLVSEVDQLTHNYTQVLQDIDGLQGSITNRVEQIEQTYSKDKETINKQLSEVTQTASTIEHQFTSITEQLENVESITTYIRQSGGGIEVGKKDAAIRTLMGAEYFAILINDEEVMQLKNDLLTIKRIMALTGIDLGNNILEANDHGFRIKWGGER